MGRPRKLFGEDLLKEYLDRQKKRLAPSSIEAYRGDITIFLEYLKGKGIKPLVVDGEVAKGYLDASPGENSTTNRRLAAVRAFYGFLKDTKRVSSNPTDGIRRYKVPKRLVKFLTKPQVETVFLSAGNMGLLWKTLVMVLYYTGMRRAEVIGLTDGNIDYDRREMSVIGKGDKERMVKFPPKLVEQLTLYKRDYLGGFTQPKTLFCVGHGTPVTTDMVRHAFRKISTDVGFKVTPHTMRRSFATHGLRAGMNISQIQYLLGHTNIETTSHYLAAQDVNDSYDKSFQ
jgi:site-specific recombinase XerD